MKYRIQSHIISAAVTMILFAARAVAAADPPTVVLLVFSGWAPSVIERTVPPAMARIQREGAFTHHLIPEFPSSDSVSRFTLSTGCRPSTHGIVNDELIDPERGLYDGALDSSWMLACEHLHAVAQRQSLRVVTWNWFDQEKQSLGAVEKALLESLGQPAANRPQLLIARFDELQDAAQRDGLESAATEHAVAIADAVVARVMKVIESLPERSSVTLLVASEHGLLPVWTNVNLARILRANDVDVDFAAAGTTALIYSKPEQLQPVIQALSRYQRQIQIYAKGSTPPEWRFSTSARSGELIVTANPPYILESPRRWPRGSGWLAPWGPEMIWARSVLKASSGYPPSARGMPGLLYAWGAGIAPAGRIVRLNLLDLHPTICRLLGIDPGKPVDGAVMPSLLGGKKP